MSAQSAVKRKTAPDIRARAASGDGSIGLTPPSINTLGH
jgi:hypothetical protein